MTDTALLVIDMFNDYRHPDGEKLAVNAARIIDPLAALINNANDRDDIDLIYINDNHGDFTADHHAIISAALDGEHPELIEPLVPLPRSRLLTKVRHSVFYSTALDYLLHRLRTRRIVLTGQVTEQCILYSALDSYVRHYKVVVPPEAVAHIDAELGAVALKMMQRNMGAELVSTSACLG